MNTRSLGIAALIAGLVIALLSNLPFINLVNCLLCAWVWLGGILAVYLYQRNEPAATLVKPEQGALIGAIAGVAAAFIGAIIGAIFGAASNAFLLEMIRNNPQLSEQFGDLGRQLFATGGSVLFTLACNLVLYTAFGAIGGLIGAAILKPKAPPAM